MATRGHAVKKEQSNRKKPPHKYQRSPFLLPGLSDTKRCSTAVTPRPWKLRRSFPMEGLQLAKPTETSDVYTAVIPRPWKLRGSFLIEGIQLAKTTETENKCIVLPRDRNQKRTMTASLVMVRAGHGSSCAVLLPFLHGRLVALAQSTRSFARALVAIPFQSIPFLRHPEKQNAPRTCSSDLKNPPQKTRAG